jgi:septum formation protein
MNRIDEPTKEQLHLSSLVPELVLASSSPNRRKLLEISGIKVHTFTPDADESTVGMSTEEAMKKNAGVKMEAYLSSPSFVPTLPAVSADTLVEIDGALLGKPKDYIDARRMLQHLSGRVQTVYTGCAIYRPEKKGFEVFCDKADVVFRLLSKDEIDEYLQRGEWQGAAGAYRLQKTGWTLVEKIDGDWATVVGLPVNRLIEYFSAE